MKKNLFEISEQEKKEIFEKHELLKYPSKYKIDTNFLTEAKPKSKKQTSEDGNTEMPEGTALPTWVADYPCLSNSNNNLSATGDDNKVYTKFENGVKFYYFKSGTFKVKYKDGEIEKGTWKCENGDNLRIKLPNSNKQWTPSKEWHILYTKCPEQPLEYKKGCNNNTIKRVQACLGMDKKYQTGNFGPITQKALKGKGQDETIINTNTIINVCGPNDPLVVGSSGSSGTSGTGASGTSDTGASGTPDTGASGTSGTGASGTSGAGASGTSGSSGTGIVKSKYASYRTLKIPEGGN
jgi:hypothetical protein